MFSSSDSNNQHHARTRHSELPGHNAKQYGGDDSSYGTRSHHKHDDISTHNVNPLTSYDTHDNDPNRNSRGTEKMHPGKHRTYNHDVESYGSGNRDSSSYSTPTSSNTGASGYSQGSTDPSLGDNNLGTKHHHHQGAGFNQQQPQGSGHSQQHPLGTGYNPDQQSTGYNHGVKATEFDNDKNKRHEDQSFASKMIGKVKHAVGADHPKDNSKEHSKKHHHNKDRY